MSDKPKIPPKITPKITPCLWFNFNAEEAVHFYLGLFKNSRILETSRYGASTPGLEGKVLGMTFDLDGQRFRALNAGPQFPFTEAVSMSVDCEDGAEVDRLWGSLCEGGSPGRCGWLKDKYGLSWQIVPRELAGLLSGPGGGRAMQAMMKMGKLDVAALREAAGQASP